MTQDNLRRRQGTRPAMGVLRAFGWLELAVSVIMILADVPTIAIFFALASIFMGSIAQWINNRGEWYDRELGIWQQDPIPEKPASFTFTPRTTTMTVISGLLLIGAAAVAVLGGPTIMALLLVLYAISVVVQLNRS